MCIYLCVNKYACACCTFACRPQVAGKSLGVALTVTVICEYTETWAGSCQRLQTVVVLVTSSLEYCNKLVAGERSI